MGAVPIERSLLFCEVVTTYPRRFKIRNALPSEHSAIGEMMVEVYSSLEGFPKPPELPEYYDFLANVGKLAAHPGVKILVAVDSSNKLLGGVVWFGDMKFYHAGLSATERDTGGFRLLAVSDAARGLGIGKALTLACIAKAKRLGLKQVIIHTTKAMMPAWKMYERLGFVHSEDLDFVNGGVEVFGLRLRV
jgi:GNAT superfamily N-acetyltransferase